MKIAICIFGQFRPTHNNTRGFKEPYKYLKRNILDMYDCDIFIHGWDQDDDETQSMLDLYTPKKYIVEKQIDFKLHPTTRQCINKLGTFSRMYSLKTCIDLIDDNYDFILATRFDAIFYGSFKFEMLNPAYFYITDWERSNWIQSGIIGDAWFLTGFDNMHNFSRLYDKLYDYLDDNSAYLSYYNNPTNISIHTIWRYRLFELGLIDKVYCYGKHGSTWKYLRNHNRDINVTLKPPFKTY